MPLIHSKSKKAIGENIEKEMDEGKPKKQSIAIALSVQRNAKAKKMAQGGMIPSGSQDTKEPPMPSPKPDDRRLPPKEYMSGKMDSPEDQQIMSMVESILMKRRGRMMAEGGMVDIEENGEESGSTPFDTMNSDAAKKELYDDSQLSPQPEDSNQHGDDIESDAHDMISKIRAKIRAKRGA